MDSIPAVLGFLVTTFVILGLVVILLAILAVGAAAYDWFKWARKRGKKRTGKTEPRRT